MTAPARAALDRVRALLAGFDYRYANEKQLQDGLESVLRRAGLPFKREVRLSLGDVVDFVVEPGVGVEVKVDGNLGAVTRQLHRYVQLESLSALLLVTTRARLDHMPAEMNGKPVDVLVLAGGIFR